jgi:hypothetical protein
VITLGDFGLRLQVSRAVFRAPADVVHALQVFARVLEPQLGLASPLAVLRDARCLFQEDAQLFGLRLDHARNHSLLDDRVGACAQARAEENVGDVAPRARACC